MLTLVPCTRRSFFTTLFFSVLFTLLLACHPASWAATPMIAMGDRHVCALSETGTVQCWGDNNAGQLGNGTMERSATPVTVIGVDNAISIFSSGSRMCAALRGGSAKCWGDTSGSFWKTDSLGNFTIGYDLTPVTVKGITDAIAVGGNMSAPCFILSSGKVKCWHIQPLQETNPIYYIEVAGINNAIATSGGREHTCVLLRTGEIRCWGDNTYGQLGDGSTTNSTVPVTVQGIQNPIAITGRGNTTCAVLQTGYVQCWGTSILNPTVINTTPTTINGISNAIGVAFGSTHLCVLLKNSTVQCVGVNANGVLGNMSLKNSDVPITVTGINNVISLSSSYTNTCALIKTGEVQCWGSNQANQRGNTKIPTIPSSPTPVNVQNINNAISISTSSDMNCALLRTGAIQCWSGYNDGTPTLINGINNAISVVTTTSYDYNGCALLQNGEVRCWDDKSRTSTKISNISDAISISKYQKSSYFFDSLSYSAYFCATLRSGGVRCWGDGKNVDTLLDQFPADNQYENNSCELFDGGKVRCKGKNDYGQLGIGVITYSNMEEFATVVGINNAVAVSSSDDHSCAVLSTGIVQCWGSDRNSALGAGALSYLAPSPVMGVGGQGYLNLFSFSQGVDKVFAWAESHLPQFTPRGGNSQSLLGYRYRGYQDRYYLAVNEGGTPHVYYFDNISMNTLMDVGLLSDFLGN